MSEIHKKSLTKIFYIFLSLLGVLILDVETYRLGIFASFLLVVIFMYEVKRVWGYVSLAFLFLFFFLIYSFSVPFSIIFDIKLSSYNSFLVSTWEQIDDSLIIFSFCVHLAIIGMILAFLLLERNFINSERFYKTPINICNNINYFKISIALGIISTLFQLINFIRVGGFTTLSQGKLIYQSAISDISMILPDQQFFNFSIILFILSIRLNNDKMHILSKIIISLSSNMLFLFINLYIGERGALLAAMFIGTMTYFYFSPLFKIKIKYLLIGVSVYLLFVGITTYRFIYVDYTPNSTEELVTTMEQNEELVELLLNPANNEFGATCLNFRMMYTSSPYFDLRYGADYVHFATQLLPMRINPIYDKSLTVQFRDKYIPERGVDGSIGGTGYSAIMEAFLNFSYLGPLLIYFLVFLFIMSLEIKKRSDKSSLYSFFVYVSFLQILLLFQRSSFEYVFIQYLFILLFSFIISKLSQIRNEKDLYI